MSAGSFVGLAVNVALVGGLTLCMSAAVDYLVNIGNTMLQSQDGINTLGNLGLIFKAACFIFILMLVYNHIVNSNAEINQEV